VISRGDRREAIFLDDQDRWEFLHTFEGACCKTDWQAHAYCLMPNHFHLVLETPQPNLVLGMKWLLGTYTQCFNRRHQHGGHLFGGRYKAQLIDGRSPGYLRSACDYVHLNPVRAGIVGAEEKLECYPWSSYPAYRKPRLRPPWLRVDRLLGEHGLIEDTARSRRELERIMNQARLAPGDQVSLQKGWRIGAEDFRDWLAEKLGRRGRKGERARERSETDAALAERLVLEALTALRWRETDLAMQPKGHRHKVQIAAQLRAHTPMSYRWIADRLRMGSGSHVFQPPCQSKIIILDHSELLRFKSLKISFLARLR
jgi:REP element-mobilizing transposase RayT